MPITHMNHTPYNLIVIGAGAAGLFAAVTAAEAGAKVLVLERNDRIGKKLAITGKGRCNVTNDASTEDVLKNIPRNSRFLYSSITNYPPEKVIAFFEERGCPLKVERGNRVFPASDRSADIISVFSRLLDKLPITLKRCRVTKLLVANDRISGVETDRGEFLCNKVILATGGASYPLTGSTGDGYALVEALGHKIIPPTGSLVPLVSSDACGEMQGLSLRNTELKLLDKKGKVVFKDFGELLFTHFGISGPMALSASAHLKEGQSYEIALDLKPALDEGKLDTRFLRDLEKYSNRSMENALADLYPHSMIPVILKMSGIPMDLKAHSLTKAQRRELLLNTKSMRFPVIGTRPVEEAIITRGGISVKEVDPKTMESKLISGLYFAGEVLDCDAYTGGFNLQIAWSTAFAAAKACTEGRDEST